MQWSTRRFFWLLGLITAAGLAIRLGYVIGVKWDQNLWGDPFTAHFMANGIADGKGFLTWVPKSFSRPDAVILSDPQDWHGVVSVGPSATNRPIFPLYLSAFSVVGLRSHHAHMIANVMLGTGAVFVMGLVGRKIAGPRVGILAALIAAVYGNFWVNDAVLTSESMAILLSAVVLLLAYRAWESPTLKRVLVVGALCGFSALVRSEFLLLVPLLIIPLLVRRLAGRPIKERLGFLVAAGAVAALVMAPWLIRNFTIFENRVLLGADAGITLAATNCDETYYGASLGLWSADCIIKYQPKGDPSERDAFWRKRAFDYVGDNLERVPVVVAARFGRMWELFHPGSPWGEIQPNQKIAYDITEGRSEMAARISLAQFYLLAPFALTGGVILWRRKKTLAPLLALPILVSFTAMYTFGNTRYRSIAEPALVVLGAIAVEVLIVRFWDQRRAHQKESLSDPPHTEELQPA